MIATLVHVTITSIQPPDDGVEQRKFPWDSRQKLIRLWWSRKTIKAEGMEFLCFIHSLSRLATNYSRKLAEAYNHFENKNNTANVKRGRAEKKVIKSQVINHCNHMKRQIGLSCRNDPFSSSQALYTVAFDMIAYFKKTRPTPTFCLLFSILLLAGSPFQNTSWDKMFAWTMFDVDGDGKELKALVSPLDWKIFPPPSYSCHCCFAISFSLLKLDDHHHKLLGSRASSVVEESAFTSSFFSKKLFI